MSALNEMQNGAGAVEQPSGGVAEISQFLTFELAAEIYSRDY